MNGLRISDSLLWLVAFISLLLCIVAGYLLYLFFEDPAFSVEITKNAASFSTLMVFFAGSIASLAATASTIATHSYQKNKDAKQEKDIEIRKNRNREVILHLYNDKIHSISETISTFKAIPDIFYTVDYNINAYINHLNNSITSEHGIIDLIKSEYNIFLEEEEIFNMMTAHRWYIRFIKEAKTCIRIIEKNKHNRNQIYIYDCFIKLLEICAKISWMNSCISTNIIDKKVISDPGNFDEKRISAIFLASCESVLKENKDFFTYLEKFYNANILYDEKNQNFYVDEEIKISAL